MMLLHKSADRGSTRTGWLESRHGFSFAGWYDPARMGFRALRVLNEDRVAPGAGFGPHPHRDMEILTVVLAGTLEHGDSTGGRSLLRAGDVAHMRAGSGVVHSEWNASETEPLHFLQVWLRPARTGLEPDHGVLRAGFPVGGAAATETRIVASGHGDDAALRLAQDAVVHAVRVASGAPVHFYLAPGRGAWVQAVRGELVVNGARLAAGDALAIADETAVVVAGEPEGDALLFDLGPAHTNQEATWDD